MRRLFLIIVLIGLLIIVGGGVYVAALPRLLPLEGTLTVYSGEAIIRRGGGQPTTLTRQAPGRIRPGEQIEMRGSGELRLARVSLDLLPGTRLTLVRQRWSPIDGWQIEAALASGQARGRVEPAATLFLFRLNLPLEATFAPDPGLPSTFLARARDPQRIEVALVSGQGTLQRGPDTVNLGPGQGVVLLREGAIAPPALWSSVQVSLYRTDLSLAAEPVTLTDDKTGMQYDFLSGWRFLVPPGQYTGEIGLLEPYHIPKMQLPPGAYIEIPFLAGEIVFELTGVEKTATLLVRGSAGAGGSPFAARSGDSLLIAPGIWTLSAALDSAPDLPQEVQVDLQPGQKKSLLIDGRLFGGAALRVAMGNADPVQVRVFRAGAEGKDPVAVFRSDQNSQVLPQGRYVLAALTQPIAARFEVEIRQGQQLQPAEVKFGELRVNYTDPRGRPALRTVIIAVAGALRSVEKNIMEIGGDPALRFYRLGTQTNQAVRLPAGKYTILVDDSRDVLREDIEVKAGEITTLDLQIER